jgi:hypothetical protein
MDRNLQVATGLLKMMLSNSGFYAVVAENEGNVVGSNFLDERGLIAGVGPISVDPESQNQTIEHLSRITAYATGVAFFAHAVAETDEGLKALIGAAPHFLGGGFLLPTRNGEMFRWCLQNDLRLVHQMTLMTIGLYNEPAGAYLPSVLY